MKNKVKTITISLILLFLLLGINSVNAHGADVTEDVMVIGDNSTGIIAKSIVDDNGYNISVYKFTSDDEVNHQLEHMLSNNNKKILMTSYQDTANDFLKNHNEVSNRLIIVNSDNESIANGLSQLNNSVSTTSNSYGFAVPLIIGLIIGMVIGLAGGVLLMKNKYKNQ